MQTLASPATGHWVTCPSAYNCLIFRSLQSHTNSDIRLHVVAYPVKLQYSIFSTDTVAYCGISLHNIISVTLNLFSFSFVTPFLTKSRQRHYRRFVHVFRLLPIVISLQDQSQVPRCLSLSCVYHNRVDHKSRGRLAPQSQ